MKKICFISLLFVSVLANAQSQKNDTVNFTDQYGLKQGHWLVMNVGTKEEGFKFNHIQMEGIYKNNIKEGVWKTFYPNANLKCEITYENGHPKGRMVVYDQKINNKIIAEGKFERGAFITSNK